ncbi:hypothetical protein [Streptomyces sudanensis]|uniref:hypothetical protein n=1 Tax=Streptomyces sudanensis TaxID=436397 RepID=UPI00355664A5
MTKHIRRAAVLCLVLLAALLVNTARVQVLQADRLDANPANRRAALSRYAEPRGDILVEGRPVTGSQDTGELLRYERTYTDGPLYAPVTGHVSQTYGTTLVEEAEDAVLSGTSARLPWTGPGRRSPATSPRPSGPPSSGSRTGAWRGGGARSSPWNRPAAGSWPWCPARRTTRACCPARAARSRRRGRGSTPRRAGRC